MTHRMTNHLIAVFNIELPPSGMTDPDPLFESLMARLLSVEDSKHGEGQPAHEAAEHEQHDEQGEDGRGTGVEVRLEHLAVGVGEVCVLLVPGRGLRLV